MKFTAKRVIGPGAFLLAFCLFFPGFGSQQAVMRPTRPTIGKAFTYIRSSAKGERLDSYVEHIEELAEGSVPAFQRIQEYKNRVVRATVRQSDLAPLFTEHLWKDGTQRLLIKYEPGQARVTLTEKGAQAFDKTLKLPAGTLDNDAYLLNFFGYPFAEGGEVPMDVVVYYDKRVKLVTLEVEGKGRKAVKTPAGTFDCNVLELSLSGFWGGLAPSSDFLLATDNPPYLVKVEWGSGEVTELIKRPEPCSETVCKEKAALPR